MAERAQKFGLDAQLEKERLAKYDTNLEQKARQWMADVLGRPVDTTTPFNELLKSGVLLCEYGELSPAVILTFLRVINAVVPGTVKKIGKLSQPFVMMVFVFSWNISDGTSGKHRFFHQRLQVTGCS